VNKEYHEHIELSRLRRDKLLKTSKSQEFEIFDLLYIRRRSIDCGSSLEPMVLVRLAIDPKKLATNP
jgi:hypothetical protein